MKRLLLRSTLLVTLLSACASNKPAPALHDFGVMLTPKVTNAAQPLLTVDAPKWLWDTAIRYRLLYASPTTVRTYQLDRWLAPPPEMLQQQWLAAGIKLDSPVAIHLLAFEQQFSNAQTATVALRFIAEQGEASESTRSRREFDLQQACQTADAAGAVNAFAEAVKQAAQQLEQWRQQTETRRQPH
ncbi:hypothetical protein JCM14076_27790 [Methylosoma difficile]